MANVVAVLLYGPEPGTERVLEKVEVDLPDGPAAVSAAREHVAGIAEAWGWARCADPAAVCVSEVTTALLVLGCRLRLAVLRFDDHLTVELQCQGADQRFSTLLGSGSADARGIAVIDGMVPLWGVRPADDGEAIWFEVR